MRLSDAMKREYSASKASWAAVLVLQGWAFTVAILSLFYEGKWSFAALVSAVFVPLLTAFLKKYGGERYDQGEGLRRRLVRSDGMGVPVGPAERLALVANVTALPSVDPDPIGSYYSSPKPPGPARLAHIMAQSALFTKRHANTARLACWFFVALGVGLGLLLLLSVAAGGAEWAHGFGAKVAQAASAVMVVGFTGEFFQLAVAYGDLAGIAGRTLEDCARLAEEPACDAEAVRLAVESYDCALAKAPPIPGIVYRLQRRRLDEAWEMQSSHRASISAPPAATMNVGGSVGSPAVGGGP